MRLLNTVTGEFRSFSSHDEVRYAILSHVWDPDGEQSYMDIRAIQESICPIGHGARAVLAWVCRVILLCILSLLSLICTHLRLFLYRARLPLLHRMEARLAHRLAEWCSGFEAAAQETRLRAFNILYGSRVCAKVRGACAVARAHSFRHI